jgi:hypothetical protein
MSPKLKFVFLILVILSFTTCRKDIAKNYSGKYRFTTKASWWNVIGHSDDSIIIYNGSIIADSKNILKIEFGPSQNTYLFNFGTIYPTVDGNGNLSYADWLDDPRKSFSGSFNDDGELNISMTSNYLGGGGDNIIHGSKY